MTEQVRFYVYLVIFVVSLVAILLGLFTQVELTDAITAAGAIAASGLAVLNTSRKPGE